MGELGLTHRHSGEWDWNIDSSRMDWYLRSSREIRIQGRVWKGCTSRNRPRRESRMNYVRGGCHSQTPGKGPDAGDTGAASCTDSGEFVMYICSQWREVLPPLGTPPIRRPGKTCRNILSLAPSPLAPALPSSDGARGVIDGGDQRRASTSGGNNECPTVRL